MRNTSDSREVTRHVGHVERERPAPEPACDLTNAREASPILGKSCVSRWLLSTLEDASCCHPVRNPCSKSAGLGWLGASNQSVPRGRFKTHFADQIPGCLGCFCETRCLCSANSCRNSAISGWQTRIIGRQPNWPNKRAPSCAWHCANQDLPKRDEVWRLLELPLRIGPNPLEGCVSSAATNSHHGARKLFNRGRADHSQMVTRSGRSAMEKQEPSGLNVSHRRDAL